MTMLSNDFDHPAVFAALETLAGTWLSDGSAVWAPDDLSKDAKEVIRLHSSPWILDVSPVTVDLNEGWRSVLLIHRVLNLGEQASPRSGGELLRRYLHQLPQQPWILPPDDTAAIRLTGREAKLQVKALAGATAHLCQRLQAQLNQTQVHLLEECEFPAHRTHQRITRTGIHLDSERMRRIREQGPVQAERMAKDLAQGGCTNPDDESVIAAWLERAFDWDGDLETMDDDLKLLATKNPVCEQLRQYRKLTALLTQPWLLGPSHIHPVNHTLAATTGRTITTGPAIGGIPKPVRPVVVPAPGLHLAESDVSSMDLCSLAALARDPALAQLCGTGMAIGHLCHHLFPETTAIPVQNLDGVDKAQGTYQATKAVVYGVIYGREAKSLARALGIKEPRAEYLIRRLLAPYPQVRTWRKQMMETVALNSGAIEICPGLVRHLRADERAKDKVRNRRAVNTPVQGFGGMLFRRCTALAERRLRPLGGQTVLVNHDSLLWQAPPEAMDEAERAIQAVFQEVCKELTEGRVAMQVKCNRKSPLFWSKDGSIKTFERMFEGKSKE